MSMTDVSTGFVCEFCEREFPTERGAAFHEERWCSDNPDSFKSRGQVVNVGRPKKDVGPDLSVFDLGPDTAETTPQESGETAPEEPPHRGWRDKLWGNAAPAAPAPQTSERKPRKRRKNTEGIWQLIWTGLGRGLIYTSADIPVGNALTFQAPVVGPIMDRAIAGTFVDTLLQPLAGAGERFQDVSDVVSLPVLVGLMERSPALAPALEPLLRQVIRRHLVEYAKMVKAQKKADEQYRKALDDLGMPDVGDDPIDGILAQIWTAPPGTAEPATNGVATGSDVRP